MGCPNSYLRIFTSLQCQEMLQHSHQCDAVLELCQHVYLWFHKIFMILQKYTRQHTEALKSLLGCPVSLFLRCAMSKNVMIWSLWFVKTIHERHKKGVFLSWADGKVSCKNRFNLCSNLFQACFFRHIYGQFQGKLCFWQYWQMQKTSPLDNCIK